MAVADSVRPGRIGYRWVVVAVGFTIWSVAFGIQNTFGVFFKPLQESFGLSRAATSWAMTAHLLVFALAMVPIGWIISRVGIRRMLFLAAFLVGGSLCLSSLVSAPWQLYLSYGFPLAIGVSICGPPVMAMVTRWFDERRGLALGITSGGTGLGTLLVAPISNWLIGSYQWRTAFLVLGISSFFALFACACFARERQVVKEASSKAPATSQPAPAAAGLPSKTFGQAVRVPALYLIIAAQALASFALRVTTVHLVPYALDIGITASMAALAVGAIGGVSILGRLIMGFVQDKIGARPSMMICMGIQGLAVLALPFIRSDLVFFAYAVVFGFTYGGDVPQPPAMTAQLFGLTSLGMIFGLVMAGGNLAGAAGPTVAGYIYDSTGQYVPVFLLISLGLFIGVFCLWRLKLPKTGW